MTEASVERLGGGVRVACSAKCAQYGRAESAGLGNRDIVVVMAGMKSAHGFGLLATAKRLDSLFRATASVALAVCGLASAACAHPHPDEDESGCGVVGTWIDPATSATIATDQLLAGLAQRPVVLLGETHDNAEHHRWQLHTLAALHGHHPNMILGFESFPRRVQPVLDQWVNGELDPVAFLEAADWTKVWGFDPSLYLPLFDFARQNRIPMIALNIDRPFVARVRHEGWSEIPADQRFGLSDPASPALEYRKALAQVYAVEQLHAAKHPEDGDPHQAEVETDDSGKDADTAAAESDAPETETEAQATESEASETETEAQAIAGEASENEADAITDEVDIDAILESEDFARFVGAQQTWDRAMAEALAAARKQHPDSLVVGILGRGHL